MTRSGRPSIACLCAALATILSSVALAEAPQGQPHVHGKATLSLVIEEKSLTIEFAAPLHDLAGFEHAAKTADDRATLARLRQKLEKPQAIVSLPSGAGCTTRSVMIEGIGAERHAHDHGDAKHHEDDDDGHADVIATYTLSCSALNSLSEVNVAVQSTFPAISSVDVAVLGPGTQFARKLTGTNTLLRLR